MSLIDEVALREAALQLLASSSIARYAREASRIAIEHGLMAHAEHEPHPYLDRVRALMPSLTQGPEEETPETFEAALIVCALARTANETIIGELRDILAPGKLRSPWLRALAHRIPQFGPPTQRELSDLETRIENLLRGSVQPPAALELRDNNDPKTFPRAA